MQHKIDKKDVLIMTIMTVLYLILALINLGDIKVPQAGYTPKKVGEEWSVNFKEKHRINRINYYCGLGSNRDITLKVAVFYRINDNYYSALHVGENTVYIEKKMGECFKLKSLTFDPIETDQLYFRVTESGGELNSISIYDVDSKTPIKDIQVEENTNEDINRLFNRQDITPYESTYKNSTYKKIR